MGVSAQGKFMKVIAINGFGSVETFRLESREEPFPKENEVRIRIVAAGFNPVDWKIRCNCYGGDPKQVLGFDCSGIIDQVGTNIRRFSVGDEVYAMTLCSSNGSYAQYSCVPEELVEKKPKNLSFNEAAAVPLASMTAYRATLATSAVKEGDVVLIIGAGGGVGSFAMQFLKYAKVKTIYTVAKNEESAQFLIRTMGFDRNHILVYDTLSIEELKERLLQMNNGRFFDATFDFVGGEMKRLCLELTGYSGHFSTILPEEKFEFHFWGECSIPRGRNLSVHQVNIGAELADASRYSMQVYVQHLRIITDLLESETIKPPVITIIGTFNVKTVQDAHLLLEGRRVKGKLVMEVMEKETLERIMESRSHGLTAATLVTSGISHTVEALFHGKGNRNS